MQNLEIIQPNEVTEELLNNIENNRIIHENNKELNELNNKVAYFGLHGIFAQPFDLFVVPEDYKIVFFSALGSSLALEVRSPARTNIVNKFYEQLDLFNGETFEQVLEKMSFKYFNMCNIIYEKYCLKYFKDTSLKNALAKFWYKFQHLIIVDEGFKTNGYYIQNDNNFDRIDTPEMGISNKIMLHVLTDYNELPNLNKIYDEAQETFKNYTWKYFQEDLLNVYCDQFNNEQQLNNSSIIEQKIRNVINDFDSNSIINIVNNSELCEKINKEITEKLSIDLQLILFVYDHVRNILDTILETSEQLRKFYKNIWKDMSENIENIYNKTNTGVEVNQYNTIATNEKFYKENHNNSSILPLYKSGTLCPDISFKHVNDIPGGNLEQCFIDLPMRNEIVVFDNKFKTKYHAYKIPMFSDNNKTSLSHIIESLREQNVYKCTIYVSACLSFRPMTPWYFLDSCLGTVDTKLEEDFFKYIDKTAHDKEFLQELEEHFPKRRSRGSMILNIKSWPQQKIDVSFLYKKNEKMQKIKIDLGETIPSWLYQLERALQSVNFDKWQQAFKNTFKKLDDDDCSDEKYIQYIHTNNINNVEQLTHHNDFVLRIFYCLFYEYLEDEYPPEFPNVFRLSSLGTVQNKTKEVILYSVLDMFLQLKLQLQKLHLQNTFGKNEEAIQYHQQYGYNSYDYETIVPCLVIFLQKYLNETSMTFDIDNAVEDAKEIIKKRTYNEKSEDLKVKNLLEYLQAQKQK